MEEPAPGRKVFAAAHCLFLTSIATRLASQAAHSRSLGEWIHSGASRMILPVRAEPASALEDLSGSQCRMRCLSVLPVNAVIVCRVPTMRACLFLHAVRARTNISSATHMPAASAFPCSSAMTGVQYACICGAPCTPKPVHGLMLCAATASRSILHTTGRTA